MSDNEGFMSRWSKRKVEADAETEEDRIEEVAEVAAEDDRPDSEILEAHGLIDPDEMGKGDDFSGFMKSDIPTQLRNRALRKLWTSNPLLANVDGLVDYGEDFKNSGEMVGKITTLYQVGKGYLKPEVDEDELADAAEPSENIEIHDELTDEFPEENTRIEEDDSETEISDVETLAPKKSAKSDETPPIPPRKRMDFTF